MSFADFCVHLIGAFSYHLYYTACILKAMQGAHCGNFVENIIKNQFGFLCFVQHQELCRLAPYIKYRVTGDYSFQLSTYRLIDHAEIWFQTLVMMCPSFRQLFMKVNISQCAETYLALHNKQVVSERSLFCDCVCETCLRKLPKPYRKSAVYQNTRSSRHQFGWPCRELVAISDQMALELKVAAKLVKTRFLVFLNKGGANSLKALDDRADVSANDQETVFIDSRHQRLVDEMTTLMAQTKLKMQNDKDLDASEEVTKHKFKYDFMSSKRILHSFKPIGAYFKRSKRKRNSTPEAVERDNGILAAKKRKSNLSGVSIPRVEKGACEPNRFVRHLCLSDPNRIPPPVLHETKEQHSQRGPGTGKDVFQRTDVALAICGFDKGIDHLTADAKRSLVQFFQSNMWNGIDIGIIVDFVGETRISELPFFSDLCKLTAHTFAHLQFKEHRLNMHRTFAKVVLCTGDSREDVSEIPYVPSSFSKFWCNSREWQECNLLVVWLDIALAHFRATILKKNTLESELGSFEEKREDLAKDKYHDCETDATMLHWCPFGLCFADCGGRCRFHLDTATALLELN